MSDINEFALRGIRAEIERLQALERQLTQRTGRKGGIASFGPGRGSEVGNGRTTADVTSTPAGRTRKLSAAGRKAISDAAKARWARQKSEKGADSAAVAKKGGKKR